MATQKKLISLENKDFIDCILKDIAATNRTSESSIAEDILLGYRSGLLPNHKVVADIVLSHYTSDDAPTLMLKSIITTLNTTRSDYEKNHALPLVKMVVNIAANRWLDKTVDGNRFCIQIDMLVSCYQGIINLFKELLDEPIDYKYASIIAHEETFLKSMFDQLNKGIPVNLSNFPGVLPPVWDYVCTKKYAFIALETALSFCTIPNTPEERLKVVHMLADISTYWG